MNISTLIPLVIAAAIAFVVGGIWYGPLFGKVWKAELSHKKSGDLKQSSAARVGLLFQGLYLIAVGFVVFAIVHGIAATTSAINAAVTVFLMLGVMTGLGVIADGLFMGYGRKFIAVNLGQQLLMLAIFAVAAACWAVSR